jgi:hypothetical protein
MLTGQTSGVNQLRAACRESVLAGGPYSFFPDLGCRLQAVIFLILFKNHFDGIDFY